MRKLLLRLAPLLALVVLATGCVRVDLAIAVHDDGSGTLSMLMAIDQQLLALTQQSGQAAANPFDQLEQTPPSQLPPGAKVEPYQQDGFVGARLTFPFAAGDDVATTLDQTFADVAASAAADVSPAPTPGPSDSFQQPGTSPLQDFTLRRQSNGGWRFQATVPSQIPAADSGIDPATVKTLFKDASFTVHLALPGHVTQTNADEQHGNELTWNIDPLGDARTLTAESAPGGGAPTAFNVAGLVVASLALVGGALWVARRHGRLLP